MPSLLLSLILAATLAMPAQAAGPPHCEKGWRHLLSELRENLAPFALAALVIGVGGAVYVARKDGLPKPISENDLPTLSPEQIRECLKGEIAKFKAEKPMVHFPVDGCYARAADFIEQIQKACLTELKQIWISGSLKPCDSVSWAWHTAAAFRGPDGAVFIVDPSFSDEPIAMSHWQVACRGDKGEVSKVFFSQCAGPRQLIHMQTNDAKVESVRCFYGCYGTLAEAYAACDRGSDDKNACGQRASASCLSCEQSCGDRRPVGHSCNSVPRQGFQLPKIRNCSGCG